MNWIAASLLSALFLGCYNLGVKHAVAGNAVVPLLFTINLIGALTWTGVMLWGAASLPLVSWLQIAPLEPWQHLQVLVKSMLMVVSWLLTYAGLKRLPVSIAAPIQSTGPVWILLGGVTIFSERLSLLQWIGVCITLGSFMALSLVGSREGIHFYRNKAVFLIIGGALMMGMTGLYDKYLFGEPGFDPATVQAWFSIYMVLLLLPFIVFWFSCRKKEAERFVWRWSILVIVFSIVLADFIYYQALQSPEAMISVVSSLRRADVLVAFTGGVLFFSEKVNRTKLMVVLCLLAGIVITIMGRN